MLTLFYIRLYHHRDNCFERVLVTAKTLEDAQVEVLNDRSPGWRIEAAYAICQTGDSTYQEVG